MADPLVTSSPETVPPPPAELGRSYSELLSRQGWEVDVPEAPAPSGEPSPTVATAVPPSPQRIIEAMLFLGGPPLTAVRAIGAIRGLTPALFQQAIDRLNQDYRRQGRPYTIRPQDQGYALTLRPRYRSVVDRLYGGPRTARLSGAAIDVLALVAYRQPATKQEIDSLRGGESGALLRQLVRRGLIAVVQRADATGREVSYGTTARFLELFGLKNLDDLPRTQDLQRL